MNEERRDPSTPDRRRMPRFGGRRRTDSRAEWMSVTNFAEKYGIDRKTVRKWLRAEILLTYQVGLLIRVRDLPPDAHIALRKLGHTGKVVQSP